MPPQAFSVTTHCPAFENKHRPIMTRGERTENIAEPQREDKYKGDFFRITRA